MSEEMKAGVINATLQGAPTEEMNEESAKAKAEAEAKARRQEERRKRLEGVKAERLKQQEESGRRQESDEAKRIAREKKMAQLAHAENYRQKLKDEQERRRALRTSKKKTVVAADDASAIKQAEDDAMLAAKERNEKNAELLNKFNEKQKASELLAEELKNAPKPERKAFKMTPEGPIYITEDGKELIAGIPAKEKEGSFSGIDLSILNGLGGSLASERGPKADVQTAEAQDAAESAKEDAIPEPSGIDLSALEGLGGSLASEGALYNPEDRIPEAPATPAEAPAEVEEAPEAEETPEEEIDYNISIDAVELLAPIAPVIIDKKENEAAEAQAPAEEEPATEEPTAEEPVAEEPIAEPEPAPDAIDSKLAALLAGLGTYELVTTKADFGDDFNKKKSEIEEMLSEPDDAGDAVSVPERDISNLEYDAGFVYTYEALGLVDKKKVKREKKELRKEKKKEEKLIALGLLPPNGPTVFDELEEDENEPEENTDELASVAADTEANSEDEANDNTAEAAALGAVALAAAGAVAATGLNGDEAEPADDELSAKESEANEISADENEADELSAKENELNELKQKKQDLEDELLDNEEANADELRNLREVEHSAIMNAYAAEQKADRERLERKLQAEKEAYEQEIAELEARRDQMQKEHEDRKRELKESISGYANLSDDDEDYTTPYDTAPSILSSTDKDGIVSVSYSAPDGKVYNENAAKDYDKLSEKDELALAAHASLTDAHVDRMDKHEFRKRLRKSHKHEEKLIKQDRKLERKRGDEREVLVERLGVRRMLLESYIADLNCSILAESNKYTKKYDRLVSEAAGEYNGLIDVFADKTGTNPPRVDERISERIIAGEGTPLIPIIHYELLNSNKGRRLTREERNYLRREQLNYLKFDKAVRRDYERGENTSLVPDSIAVIESDVKKMIKLDNECVKERIAYRTGTIKYELTLAQFHFDENTKAKRRHRGISSAKLRAMNRDAKKLIKQTKKNNKRYAMVMNGVDLSKVKNEAERARLRVLRQRIVKLCSERNEIDKRLIALYRDNGKGKGKKNVRNKIAKLRLNASLHMFNKLVPYYKKTKKYNIDRSLKEEIWALMNQHIDLKAYLKECIYRKKHERPKGEARRWLNTEIKNTKKSIGYVRYDLEKLLYKAKMKNEKRPNIKAQIFFTFILALIIVAVIAAISFSDQIVSYVSGLFSGWLGK